MSQVTSPSLLLKVSPANFCRGAVHSMHLSYMFSASLFQHCLAFRQVIFFRFGHQCVRWTLGTFSFAFAGTGEKCIAAKCDAWLCKLTVLSCAFYELHVVNHS